MSGIIQVIRNGTTVQLTEKLTGIVQGVLIKSETYVQYDVAWFDGQVRHTAWFEEAQLSAENGDRMAVGYRGAGRGADTP